MLGHAVLGRLVGREVQTTLNYRLGINAKSLAFLGVIGRFAFIELLLDEAIKEAEVEVEVLLGNLCLSERGAKEQVPAAVRKTR